MLDRYEESPKNFESRVLLIRGVGLPENFLITSCVRVYFKQVTSAANRNN